jgi:hypothetical protein
MSKEPALMFAPLAIAFEHLVRPNNEQTSIAGKVKRYAPLCAVGGAYLLLRIALFGKLALFYNMRKLLGRRRSILVSR